MTTPAPRILIVEDDVHLRSVVRNQRQVAWMFGGVGFSPPHERIRVIGVAAFPSQHWQASSRTQRFSPPSSFLNVGTDPAQNLSQIAHAKFSWSNIVPKINRNAPLGRPLQQPAFTG